jgi:hypothetical protein
MTSGFERRKAAANLNGLQSVCCVIPPFITSPTRALRLISSPNAKIYHLYRECWNDGIINAQRCLPVLCLSALKSNYLTVVVTVLDQELKAGKKTSTRHEANARSRKLAYADEPKY